MLKLADVPEQHGAAVAAASRDVRTPRPKHLYFAFLSYSHQDEAIADWLHDELEQFKVPHTLVGRLTENGVVPNRLAPIFRDRHELAAAGDLATEIKTALSSSRFLVVMCSPAAAKSHWTNLEIQAFKRSHPEGCVLGAIVDGEPFASERTGHEEEECFPPALRRKYDRRGRPTNKRAEPLAADLRASGDGRRIGFLKLVAGMLGVGLDELVHREETRRQRRLAWIAAASLAGMALTSGLAITAIQSRDEARDQRRQAESLVEFMLGDLRDKLEPIGRLDALDGVGSKVLAYYSKQNTGQLTDEGLLQRSRALSLTAQVAYVRGNLDSAQRLYREAMLGTAEAIRRNPEDPQRIFDHAQNVFWAADIERERGQLAAAEAGMREYKRLADRMVALAPDNMKWRMEQQSADTNLGVSLFEQRRFSEATAQFTRALQTMQGLAAADPRNAYYQKSTTESQSWLADARQSEGHLQEANALREQHVALLHRLLAQTGDVEYRQKLVPAERLLGEAYFIRGNTRQALVHFQAAVDQSEALIAREPDNSRWRSFSARARLNLAEGLLAAGQKDRATGETEAACGTMTRLLATDSSVQRWRAIMRDCWDTRARVSLSSGDLRGALQNEQRALAIAKTVQSTDPIEDRYEVAECYLLLGDIRKKLGDGAAARNAWQTGLALIPTNVAEKPQELAEHTLLLQRLGHREDVRSQAAKLASIGYRGAEFVTE